MRKDFLRCLQRNPQTEEGFYLSVRWDWKRQQKVISREARQKKKRGWGWGELRRGERNTQRGETEVDVGEFAEFSLDPGCEAHWREGRTQSDKKENHTKQQQNTNTAPCGNPPVPPFHTVISTTKTLASASETPPGSRSHTRGASLGERNEALETFFFFLLPL